MESFDCFI